MKIKILSVSQVNNYVKRLLISDPILHNVRIRGEISNFKLHSSGHMYFTLKDEKSRINCIMFKEDVELLNIVPDNGMEVTVKGYISLYERDGKYQIYISEIISRGLGDLYKAFKNLKYQLEKEGLFDKTNKKPLPFMPKKIGIITSPTGSVVRDIISVIKRRFSKVSLYIFPVTVQGEEAPQSIVKALQLCNEFDKLDVIILARGGGSLEELWAFNTEKVARAVYDSRIPTISAVGHETDFTIVDFVADIRAETPSTAGEIAVPEMQEILTVLTNYKDRLIYLINNKIADEKHKVALIVDNYNLKYPLNYIDDNKLYVDNLYSRLLKAIDTVIKTKNKHLKNQLLLLNSLNPIKILSRGYTLAMDEEDNVIRSVDNLKNDQTLRISLMDGWIKAKVTEINREDKGLGRDEL